MSNALSDFEWNPKARKLKEKTGFCEELGELADNSVLLASKEVRRTT
jgi:hypothetical protein